MTGVLLVTAPGCHWCEEARTLIERLGTEFELETATCSTEEEEGRRLAVADGILFPPAIYVDGEFLQYGRPSERKLRARLAQAGARSRASSTT